MLKIPDLPKLLTGVPAWAYLVGVGVAALAVGAVTLSNHAATHQAAKDAPAIASGVVATSASDLAERQLQATNLRASHEAATDKKVTYHVTAIAEAPDDRAAFDEYLRGLHDGEPDPSPPLPGGPLGGVQSGSRPQGAPVAAGRSDKR